VLRLAALFGLLGIAVATFIIARSGYDDILRALTVAGWGIVLTSLYHLLSFVACIIGWRLLMPGKKRPSYPFMFYILWLRASVNNLLPVARIGGEVVAVRVMMKHGMRKTTAVASTVVQLTLSVIAVFIFDTVGIGLFAYQSDDTGLIGKLIGGLLLSLPPIGILVGVQKFGFFGALDKIFKLMLRDQWKKFAGSAAHLDRAVHTIYRRKKQVLLCLLWLLITWFLGIGEIALGLYFLGHPLGLLECFMLEALIQAAVSVAFAVPGALGVQEAGFLLFGQMLGLPADIAVALAVVRRCRDVLLFIPGLIVWQIQEGKWLFKKAPV
jgi:putative membrane protein